VDVFGVVAVVYGALALWAAFRLYRNGRNTFDDNFTDVDRRIAGAAAFYFGIPLAVLLHELGHVGTTLLLGGRVEDFHYMLYVGHVVPIREPALAAQELALIAISGNLVSLAIGLGAVAWALKRPGNAAWNYTRFELARVQLWIVLVIYPALSLVARWGDFWTLREQLNLVVPMIGDASLVTWGLMAYVIWRRWKGPLRREYLWFATPLHDWWRRADQRTADNPGDAGALRDLGRVYLAGDRPDDALPHLTRALHAEPDEPETRYLMGYAHLRMGEPEIASAELRRAGLMIEEERPIPGKYADLYFEVMLGLAAARLAMDDAEGAVITAEAAHGERPHDARGLLIHTDALVAANRQAEARERLSDALTHANTALADEIRRRLRSMRD
jgi:tetratricopeptide (TPR) repeat protein